jgi:hypothetical protein
MKGSFILFSIKNFSSANGMEIQFILHALAGFHKCENEKKSKKKGGYIHF